jgi:heterodisulfide reductase subunit A2
VHCVGSLDPEHNDYCSGVCCMNALKFNELITHKLHGATVTHFFRSLVMPGKEDAELYLKVRDRDTTKMVPYRSLADINVTRADDGRISVRHNGDSATFDMVVLMPAVVAPDGARKLGELFDVGMDRRGFFDELHGRVDATRSKVRGVFLAGMCQAPMDLGRAMTQGSSAAAAVLSSLVPGRKLTLEATYAVVDGERCANCGSCMAVCPYKAVTRDEEKQVAQVNPVLCAGCGTCVAGCPSGAISGRHFTDEQIFAEIEGVLA